MLPSALNHRVKKLTYKSLLHDTNEILLNDQYETLSKAEPNELPESTLLISM